MIEIENVTIHGFEEAIRGMRNPMNSWSKSDSNFCAYSKYTHKCGECPYNKICCCEDKNMYTNYIVGPNDRQLMMKLAAGGSVHAKYRRMITVYLDITAPLYWWKEFDTYKVGTVTNSCSTMHKIHEKEFALEDFSHEHLFERAYDEDDTDCWIFARGGGSILDTINVLEDVIRMLNKAREIYLKTQDKRYWWQMIQLLPSSYNQRRTVMLNYEVLAGIYSTRKNHKLDEWREFCRWIKELPYNEIITGGKEKPDV